MDVSGRVQMAGGCGLGMVGIGLPMIPAFGTSHPWFYVGLSWCVLGVSLFVAAMIAHYAEKRRGDLDRLHAFSWVNDDGSRLTITPRDVARMPRRELQARLDNEDSERWFVADMHRRAYDALMFYYSWRGSILLTARRLGRRLRRALTP